MTTTAANRNYRESLETRNGLSQADNEGRALRGEFGVERQLVAMSEQYKRLKAAGRLDEAATIRAQGIALIAAQQEA
jgi:hypothetical protein